MNHNIYFNFTTRCCILPAEPLGNSVTSIFQATTQSHERNAYLKAKLAPILCATIYRAGNTQYKKKKDILSTPIHPSQLAKPPTLFNF